MITRSYIYRLQEHDSRDVTRMHLNNIARKRIDRPSFFETAWLLKLKDSGVAGCQCDNLAWSRAPQDVVVLSVVDLGSSRNESLVPDPKVITDVIVLSTAFRIGEQTSGISGAGVSGWKQVNYMEIQDAKDGKDVDVLRRPGVMWYILTQRQVCKLRPSIPTFTWDAFVYRPCWY